MDIPAKCILTRRSAQSDNSRLEVPAQSPPVLCKVLGRPDCFAALYTVTLRAAYALYALIMLDHLRPDPGVVESNAFTDHLIPPADRFYYAMLGVWERHDTLWYLHIARHGYDRSAAIVFYPLYPLLIRAVSWLVHPPVLAALVFSTTASFFFFWGLQVLVEFDLPRSTAVKTVYLAGLWPASFMLLAGYPDSLVAAFTVWSLCFARKQNWWLAGLLGMFAAASKAVGCVVVIPLAFLGWRSRNRSAVASALCVLPVFVYSLWTRLSGLGSISEAYQQHWHTSAEFPWVTLARCVHRFVSVGPDPLFKLNLGLFALICCLALLTPVRNEYKLYAAAALLVFLSKNTDPLLQSTMRYVLVVFPAFIGLALWMKRGVGLIVLSAFLLLINGVLLLTFFKWSLIV